MGFQAEDKKREERRKREWREPTDPVLLQMITVGDRAFADFAEVQSFIARETGLSAISDYFTLRAPHPQLSDDIRAGIPLWRLLYLLGDDHHYLLGQEHTGHTSLWRKVGSCLVFHRVDWYALAKAEISESLISEYRRRLEAQGSFTIDDLAELAVEMDSRGLSTRSFPHDLQEAGLYLPHHTIQQLLLYASLSPGQQGDLAGPDGLAFSDMTMVQRRQVIELAGQWHIPQPDRQARRASFHLVESVKERFGRRLACTELELRFPEPPQHLPKALVLVRELESAAAAE
jgi:hypothetical protein